MSKRIVSDLFASYIDADGVHLTGQRGEEIDVTAKDEKRLDAAGALEPKSAAAATVTAPVDPLTASATDLDAFVKSAKGPDVLAAAGDDGAKAAALLEAELRRDPPRSSVVEPLTAIVDKATVGD